MELYVCAIVKKEDMYLLLHHNKLNGYTTPGGKVEHNELIIDAMVREIKEEIDIDVDKIDLIKIDTIQAIDDVINTNQPYIIHVYTLNWKLEFGDPINKEFEKHSDLNWLTTEEIKELQIKRVMINYIIEKQP